MKIDKNQPARPRTPPAVRLAMAAALLLACPAFLQARPLSASQNLTISVCPSSCPPLEAPSVRLSRPSVLCPPLSACPSVRPGWGPAEPIYIKLQNDLYT